MAPPRYKTYKGSSKKGFDRAIDMAVVEYEKDWGKPKNLVTLRIVEMSVTVKNPVRDYRVELGPGA